ncbi:MAG: hypothetical protein LBQ79_07305 [Deltaproteobacteria bacterium]|jgi:hypothetical protein|nr:hypothetical protein [Deltaproteobacteria bacterium]
MDRQGKAWKRKSTQLPEGVSSQSESGFQLDKVIFQLPDGRYLVTGIKPRQLDGWTKLPDGKLWLPDGELWHPEDGRRVSEHISNRSDCWIRKPGGIFLQQREPVCLESESAHPETVPGQLPNDRPVQFEVCPELSDSISLSPPLPGFIGYEVKGNASYARYFSNTYVKNQKIYHDSLYLGKVIDKDKGVFRSLKRGTFTFTLEQGFGDCPSLYDSEINSLPNVKVLDFGDIWMFDQMLKQIGLDEVLDSLIPESADTLKSLVAYKLIHDDDYKFTERWYNNSYARFLYPEAQVESQRISEFQVKLGENCFFNRFFELNLKNIMKQLENERKIFTPMIVDSARLQNDIKILLTELNDHDDVITNEIRVTYVVDINTNIPMFLRITCENIIDNSLLISTINMLASHNINVKIIIMDVEHSSQYNISELFATNIPFITRMPINIKEYKQLINEHGPALKTADNTILHNGRAICGKMVKVNFDGYKMFAYLMLDIATCAEEEINAVIKNDNDYDRNSQINSAYLDSGIFVLISSNEYGIDKVIELYFERQSIETILKFPNDCADMLQLNEHCEETIRGMILLSFIATIVYSSISSTLNNTKYSTKDAIVILRNLQIQIYDRFKIIESLDIEQNEIFKYLNLENPFYQKTGNVQHENNSFLNSVNSVSEGRGSPKGSKNQSQTRPSCVQESFSEGKIRRGRPKGSKNKQNNFHFAVTTDDSDDEKRKCRPEGSKNKMMDDPSIVKLSSNEMKRGRGRPKGSKNRTKEGPHF